MLYAAVSFFCVHSLEFIYTLINYIITVMYHWDSKWINGLNPIPRIQYSFHNQSYSPIISFSNFILHALCWMPFSSFICKSYLGLPFCNSLSFSVMDKVEKSFPSFNVALIHLSRPHSMLILSLKLCTAISNPSRSLYFAYRLWSSVCKIVL